MSDVVKPGRTERELQREHHGEKVMMHPVVHRRRVTAAVLTALTVALGIVLLVGIGPEMLAVYLPSLPMALILLWASTGELRADEREIEHRPVTLVPVEQLA